MAGTGAGYDLSTTTFSPDGRVFQIEYAMKAVDNSGTCLGLVCKDGVLVAVEKFLLSKMLVEKTNKRIFPVARHAGMASAGLVTDARQIVQRARDEARVHTENFGEKIAPHVLAERTAGFVHLFTLYGSVRPFGSSVLMAGHDDDSGYSLFCIDPVGGCAKYTGVALGKGRQTAKTELEKMPLKDMTCAEALQTVAKIIHKVHDEKDKDFELEASWICEASNNQFVPVPDTLIKEAEEKAKAAIAEEEDAE
mmetsp:Transcript_11828/g.26125  ORF Transcript_11828/g.26125 Transcript_11828/m.26125 type:complete len:251 (-) Transcript_11828:207-959(-)|eukprot:CAMPEP_0204265360 /NCGR_PEP_ID=MMETSP0468-20130131/9619_1 /ASSEMBLY_ACC=CAM_ASM_000383 /TAXON_ID=2969 /ORGANISM="Oxyrrhis marina" /LENGTH=250 /DNA_ID=CAMNT_0051240299 /DNA_START=80 /DNA_END=832 /DNA_ORIENTATION=+